MSGRTRVENRAHLIFDFLVTRLNKGFTIAELCRALGLQDGATTRAAIRRARALATEAGLHFPPAIAANGFTYKVTDLAENAMRPTAQMGRVEAGVRARKEDGIEFLRRERKTLPADLQPMADMYISVYDSTKKALAEVVDHVETMVIKIMRDRGAA